MQDVSWQTRSQLPSVGMADVVRQRIDEESPDVDMANINFCSRTGKSSITLRLVRSQWTQELVRMMFPYFQVIPHH